MKQSIQVFPSILSANFGCLDQEVDRMLEAQVDGIHIDIMDGHFVPNLSMGPKVVETIRKRAPKAFLDVHLMIYQPDRYMETFLRAGADQITFHSEATEDIAYCLDFLRKCNKKAGLAFCPETSFSLIEPWITRFDTLLLMTVNPGFGGQTFLEEVLDKIELVAKAVQKTKASCKIQVDGGIDPQTAQQCKKKGASIMVSGSYLFSHNQLFEAVESLR